MAFSTTWWSSSSFFSWPAIVVEVESVLWPMLRNPYTHSSKGAQFAYHEAWLQATDSEVPSLPACCLVILIQPDAICFRSVAIGQKAVSRGIQTVESTTELQQRDAHGVIPHDPEVVEIVSCYPSFPELWASSCWLRLLMAWFPVSCIMENIGAPRRDSRKLVGSESLVSRAHHHHHHVASSEGNVRRRDVELTIRVWWSDAFLTPFSDIAKPGSAFLSESVFLATPLLLLQQTQLW